MASSRGGSGAAPDIYKRPGILRKGGDLHRELNDELLRIEQAFSGIWARLGAASDMLRPLASGWTDLRAPATIISRAGVNPPARDVTHGTLIYAGNQNETAHAIYQTPHEWVEGTEIRPHVHWSKTTATAGDVYWELDYKIVNIGDVRPATWTTISASVPATLEDNTIDRQVITPFGSIDMTGYLISCMLFMRIRRMASDPADTYPNAAELWELDIHYKGRPRGSLQEFSD